MNFGLKRADYLFNPKFASRNSSRTCDAAIARFDEHVETVGDKAEGDSAEQPLAVGLLCESLEHTV